MNTNLGMLHLFWPVSGTGLWITSLSQDLYVQPQESIRFFVPENEAETLQTGLVTWKAIEIHDNLHIGQWPTTPSRVIMAVLDVRVQQLEDWIPQLSDQYRDQCRIVCVDETFLSYASFLRCVLLFDYLGLSNKWVPVFDKNSVDNPWHVLFNKLQNYKELEGVIDSLAAFEDLIVYRISMDGVICSITPNVARYGFVTEEIIGVPLMRFVHPEDLPHVAQFFTDIQLLQRPIVRFRVLNPNGKIFHVSTSSRFVQTSAGAMFLVGVMREETEKQLVSRQMQFAHRIQSVMYQVSGALFGAVSLEELCSSVCRILVEAESVAMALVQNDAEITSVMGLWHERLGKECRSFLSRDFLEFLGHRACVQTETILVNQHENEFKLFLIQTELSNIQSVLVVPLWYPGQRFSGKLYLFAQNADAFDTHTVELTKQVAMLLTHGVLSILDWQETEHIREHLALLEERRRYVLSNIRDIIYFFDSEGRLQFLSENVRDAFGVDPEALVGKKFIDLIHFFPHLDPQVFHTLQANFDSAVKAKKTELLFSFTWGEGENRRFMEINERIFYQENGSLQGSTGVIRDVTQRVLVQEALERSEEKYRLLFEVSQDGLFIEDIDGRILECNESALRMYGFTRNEMMQLHTVDLVSEPTANLLPELVLRLRETGVFFVEAEGRRKDGSIFPTEVVARLLHLHGKEHIIISVRDISERKQQEKERLETERRLRQKQKIESVSLLVSRLAHEFNNLLVGILGNASLGLMETTQEHPAFLLFQEIEKAAKDAAMISRQLLVYAGGWKPRLQAVNLAEILERAARDLQPAIPEQVRVIYRIEPDVFPVDADPEHCLILVSHLIANGIDAVKKNAGMVTVSLFTCETLPENFAIEIAPDHVERHNRWVCIEVVDNGCGIAPQNLEMIFDPFFTTKESAPGLGLTAVAGIVRHHNAVLQVAKLVNQGTIFRVFFVMTSEKNLDSDEMLSQESKTQCILLIDDDFWVRTVGKRMLNMAQRNCVTVSDGKQALSYAINNLQNIQLVVLDLHLPDMSGKEVFARLRALRPNLPILVSSGWTDQIEPFWDPKEAFCTGTLPKPYTTSTFLQAIKTLETATVSGSSL